MDSSKMTDEISGRVETLKGILSRAGITDLPPLVIGKRCLIYSTRKNRWSRAEPDQIRLTVEQPFGPSRSDNEFELHYGTVVDLKYDSTGLLELRVSCSELFGEPLVKLFFSMGAWQAATHPAGEITIAGGDHWYPVEFTILPF